MMENENYKLLYETFEAYQENDWYTLISDVLEFRPLKLPIVIDNELPEETLTFISSFLANKNNKAVDIYNKQLIDYYTTLTLSSKNIKKFRTLNWVFSKIKPTKYRYTLEYKFTKEGFLNELDNEFGEKLQIGLLSTLSNLRYIKDESISDYLYNRQHVYNSELFILISLRYFQKTSEVSMYFNYLEHLISKKLNTTNAHIFIESLEEFVFQSKSFKSIYEWLKNSKHIKNDNFRIFKEEMLKWINYENRHIWSENSQYCEFIFFELTKEKYVPCFTLKRMIKNKDKYGFIMNELRVYFETLVETHHLPKEFKSYSPYRLLPGNSLLFNKECISKNENISDKYIEELSVIYKLDVSKILTTNLSACEFNIMVYLLVAKIKQLAA